ncbi:MAG: hypothetical protein HY645_07425 [Acidobacteria bacterium]|nr:hypothetical protein [Acidobacteriota bacterium]
MSNLFVLSRFDQFELWLNGLAALHRRNGLPFSRTIPLPLDRDFQEEVRTSVQIAQDLIALAGPLAESEMKEAREADPSLQFNSAQDWKKQIRDYRRHARRIDEFLAFVNFLEQYKTIALALIRLPRVSRQEFKSLSSILLHEIERLRRSESQIYLKRKSYDWRAHHLIQRELLSSIEMEGIREQLEQVFEEFFRIISIIKYLQQEIWRNFKSRKVLALLSECYHSYRAFLKHLDETCKYLDHYLPELATLIYSTRCALKLEIKKVFSQELRDLELKRKIEEVYSHVENACGLLHHAFQDSFLQLIHVLKPSFNEFELFEDLTRRFQETLQLLTDLTHLRETVRSLADPGPLAWEQFDEELRTFQGASMHFLMFRDWQTFDQFAQELQATGGEERVFLLHRFEIYLSTLIGEVEKRAVLRKFQGGISGSASTALPE